MANGKRIKPNFPGKLNPQIKPHAPRERSVISFSFKHLHLDHPKFSVEGRDSRYLIKLLCRLKDVCSFTAAELCVNNSPSLRAHPIAWSDTTEPQGFAHLNEQLRGTTPYQFQISSNEHGRVHGFFIDNVFFIVWLDPSHSLYD